MELSFSPEGTPLSAEAFEARRDEWLPSEADRSFVKSLQKRAVVEPGKVAGWIAPPPKGINGLPLDYEYVRTDGQE